MKTKIKAEILKDLLPKEISELNSDRMTKDDMLMVIGWNLYREELFKKLNLIK